MQNMIGKKIRYIYFEDKGVSKARNEGLKNANNELICFLDSDDEWLPSKLEKSIRFLDEYKYDLVGHNVIMVEGKNKKENNIAARYQEAADSLFFGLFCMFCIDFFLHI